MADEYKSTELTQEEQDAVNKLFADFANCQPDASDEAAPETAEEETAQVSVPPPKQLSKKAIVAICFAAAACIGLICLAVALMTSAPDALSVSPVTLSAGNHLVAAITKDGRILTPTSASSLGGYLITTQTTDVLQWTDIVSVSVGTMHTLGLRSDGTVVSTGFFAPDKAVYPSISDAENLDKGQTEVSSWRQIVAVAAGYRHSVGLRQDGTVVAVGDNTHGQCDVDTWTDIIQISAGSYHTVGLKRDGTVVSTEVKPNLQLSYCVDCGQSNVGSWTDIVYISAGPETTIGIRDDGTVVAAGANRYGQCNVATWTDIVSVAGGIHHTVGLKRDGTVVSTQIITDSYSSYLADYNQGKVNNWEDIVAIAVTNQQTFGLKKDGTLVYAGLNTGEINETKSWKNIRLP